MANIPLIEDVKADLVRRLDAGEITKEQAQVAAQNYKTRYQDQPIQRGSEQVDKFANELKEKVTIGQMSQGDAADALRTFQFGVSGRQTPEQSRGMGGHFQFPIVPKPEGVTDKEFLVDPVQKTSVSLMDRVMEQFSGKLRTTDRIKGKPSYVQLPELNKLTDPKAFWTTLSMSSAGVPEMVSIIKSQFPEVDVEFDKKGNPIITSAEDGQEYVIHPGLEASDIVRAATELGLSFTGAKALGALRGIKALGKGAQMLDKGGRLGRGMAAGALEQAGFEGMQSSVGGSFDWGDIALSAGVGGTADVAGGALKRLFGKRKTSAGSPDLEPSEDDVKDFAKTVKKAAFGDKGATRKLVREIGIDPDAKQAFDELGIEVPTDVISDSELAKSSAGLGRSVAGSESEAAWKKTVLDATEKADQTMEELGALYSGQGPSTSNVSDKAFDSMLETQQGLSTQAGKLYDEISERVPKSSPAVFDNTTNAITDTFSEVKTSLLTKEEKLLVNLADEGDLTIRDLKRLKTKLRSASKGVENPFPTLDKAELSALEDAIKLDEIASVEAMGDTGLAESLKEANQLWAKKKSIDEQMVNAFGKDLKGSLSSKLSGMMKKAGKASGADSADLVRVMEKIPKDLRKEALLTGLADATRSTSGVSKGDFGFSQFNDLWGNLSRDSKAMGIISEELGEDSMKMLNSLQEVSKRLTDARARVIQTGKANQALSRGIEADGIISSVLRGAAKIPRIPGVRVLGGEYASRGVEAVAEAASRGGKDAKDKVSMLFNDESFKKTLSDLAEDKIPTEKTANRLSYNKAFRNFMKEINEPSKPSELKEWIIRSIRAAARDENQVGEQNKN
jgi:hypothetical protein